MELKELNFNSVEQNFYENKNIIYGAGYNGKLLYELLISKDVPVEAFFDDDQSRWGETYCGKRIFTKNELEVLDKKNTNILISSMYVAQIANKISKLGFEKIYTVIDKLLEKDTEDFKFYEYQKNQDYLDDLDYLISISKDEKTKAYFEVIKRTVLSGKAIREIIELYSGEKQYFLKCFRGKLNGINFIDAGAYTGDTVREMMEEDIHPTGVYCFEADYENYIKLNSFKQQNIKMENLICENYALWDTPAKLGMKFANYNARIDETCKEEMVEATTIDEYFQNIKVGFIKMDIEGAERKALAGGMKTIKRDRPILAISVYHGLEDIVEIPKLLMRELEEYEFIVRHHSYTYSETVLYGVPRELNIL